MENNYLKANKKLWNQKVKTHYESDFYNMGAFRAGKTALQAPELNLLGDITDLELLHLQCHFGQDSLSLARMGARVTGIDLSDKAIKLARELAIEFNLPATFHEGNVLELDKVLDSSKKYDLIFTSYGTIGWLPDLQKWGKHIAHFLKENGQFIMVDFHPVIWMFDDSFTKFSYSYFNRGPIIETIKGSYADREASIEATSYGWNHSLADLFTALMSQGLQLNYFQEFDFSPYDCFLNTVPHPNGFQIKGMEGKLPMIFALKMTQQGHTD